MLHRLKAGLIGHSADEPLSLWVGVSESILSVKQRLFLEHRIYRRRKNHTDEPENREENPKEPKDPVAIAESDACNREDTHYVDD